MSNDNTGPLKNENSPGSPSIGKGAPGLGQLTKDDLGDAYGQNHKGINRKELMDSLGEDGRKYLANMQGDYTRKNQELAEMRKQLEERQALLGEETEKQIKAMQQLPSDIDLSKPESLQQYIQAQAAAMYDKMLQPQREKQRKDNRKAELKALIDNTPDWDSHKEDVFALMKERKEAGSTMRLEDAITMVRGRKYDSKVAELEAQLKQYNEAAKAAGIRVAVGRNGSTPKRKFKTATEAMEAQYDRYAKMEKEAIARRHGRKK